MTEMHVVTLGKLCRVCGGKLARGKSPRMYKCSEFAPGLSNTFSIDVAQDDPHVHPTHFWHPCKNIVYFTGKAVEKRTEYNPGKTVQCVSNPL